MPTKIAIVEDEKLIALDIKQRLGQLGYEVVGLADSAPSALILVARTSPDLVLMDIHLRGDIDGIEAADQIKTQFNLPVVFLTAHADTKTLDQAKATQPFGYLVKPVETHNLSTSIEIAIARHSAEVALQTALAKEKELNLLKSRFISIVSHEFRNPLNVLKFAIDFFGSDRAAKSPPEKIKSRVQRCEIAIKHMVQMVDKFLMTGAAELGKLPYRAEAFDLQAFFDLIVSEFQPDMETQSTDRVSNVNLVFHSSDLLDLNTLDYALDPNLLRNIFINLISNAIKYSPAGSQIDFEVVFDRNTLTCRIQDRGMGIPLTDQAYLFTPFHRAENANKITGTGLGLSIVKQCVEIQGGSIDVSSEVGQGSCFTVTFPHISSVPHITPDI